MISPNLDDHRYVLRSCSDVDSDEVMILYFYKNIFIIFSILTSDVAQVITF